MIDEAHDRLRAARVKAGFNSPTEVAQAFGWNIETYRSHEYGRRGITTQTAEKYASALRVPAIWILFGDKPPKWYEKNDMKPGEGFKHEQKDTLRVPLITNAQLQKICKKKTSLDQLISGPSYTFINPKNHPNSTGQYVSLDIPDDDDKNTPALKPGDGITIDMGLKPEPGALALALFENEEGFMLGYLVKRNDGDYLRFKNEGYPDDKPLKDATNVFRVIEMRISI